MMFTLGTAFYPRLEDFDQEHRPILANYQPSLKQPRRTSVSEPTAQAVIAPPSSSQCQAKYPRQRDGSPKASSEDDSSYPQMRFGQPSHKEGVMAVSRLPNRLSDLSQFSDRIFKRRSLCAIPS
ncbi:hypothetical protein FOMA001_g17485 [Fusarium oxysporum f. sp. matthiolae]|nr:hypothetical protein FOMA001_g17485 [Fusarium oxysporum f. sp. matthiolae]